MFVVAPFVCLVNFLCGMSIISSGLLLHFDRVSYRSV